jgi:hypothetical protein
MQGDEDPLLQLAGSALRKAEYVVEQEEEARGWFGGSTGRDISVVCLGEQSLRLLSPPNRAIPETMWERLRAEEDLMMECESDNDGEAERQGEMEEDDSCAADGDGNDGERPNGGAGGPSDERPQPSHGGDVDMDVGGHWRCGAEACDGATSHDYEDVAMEATVLPEIVERDPYLILVKKDEEQRRKNWPDDVRKRFRAKFPAVAERKFGQHIVYVCSKARRVADNAALQHSMWLAKHLSMPLIVLSLVNVPLPVTRDAKIPARSLASLEALSEMRQHLAEVHIALDSAPLHMTHFQCSTSHPWR